MKLVPCDQNNWAINDNYKNDYTSSLIGNLNCIAPEDLASIRLTGSYFSSEFAYLEINLKLCQNSPNCASKSTIDKFFFP